MSAICAYKQRQWNLQPSLQDQCAHRVDDEDPNVWGTWNSFAVFTISYAAISASLRRPTKKHETTWMERVVGLCICVGGAYTVEKRDYLCLVDMHCTGQYKGGDYFAHVAPVLVWLTVSLGSGWFFFNYMSMLRDWIFDGGFTTKKGLMLTFRNVAFSVILAASTALNARVGLVFRGYEGLTRDFLTVAASVASHPVVVNLALRTLGKWYDKQGSKSMESEKPLSDLKEQV